MKLVTVSSTGAVTLNGTKTMAADTTAKGVPTELNKDQLRALEALISHLLPMDDRLGGAAETQTHNI